MADVLFDSLPGFSPFPTSRYDSTIVEWAVERDSTAQLLSAVTGDFDADGKSDIGMIGSFGDSTAEVMILSNSRNQGRPRLLFLSRPEPSSPSGPYDVILRRADPSLLLREYKLTRDAIEEVHIGKGAVVFFIQDGALRQLESAD